MIIKLNNKEIENLKAKNVEFDPEHDYTEDEAFDFLEKVRWLEVTYSQSYDDEGDKLFRIYGDIADKIQAQIPED